MGCPTRWEQTSEAAIRDLAVKSTRSRGASSRLAWAWTWNTPLLREDRVGEPGDGQFVLPKEDVEVKVAQVFKRLSGPVWRSRRWR
jgi:hypothetical protein